ncbi:MAG: hypothetical protein QOI76_4222 [Frankiales bacterium]|nr:hypothetical protein [Frankiales bacterium]
MPTASDPMHPELPRRAELLRYGIAVAVGALAWSVNVTGRLHTGIPLTHAQHAAAVAALTVDLAIGVAALLLLPHRRRHPLAVGCMAAALMAVSTANLGVAVVAICSLGTWRRRGWVAAAVGSYLAAEVVVVVLKLPIRTPDRDFGWQTAFAVSVGLLIQAAAFASGYYLGARRELTATARERVLAAEREQAAAADFARTSERTRIAREMHDVLAHRISLVALHAGALAYRDDLTREQTAESARTIQANAQLALAELRQVLGVLRAEDAGAVEQPQPTLAELPALVADAREAGSVITLDTSGLAADGAEGVPTTLSRTGFRVVQEALTNARKHAPGEAATVRLSGAAGFGLEVEVRNGTGPAGIDLPPSGVGLVGLAERVALAGGTLEHGLRPDGSFVLRARLPWQK